MSLGAGGDDGGNLTHMAGPMSAMNTEQVRREERRGRLLIVGLLIAPDSFLTTLAVLLSSDAGEGRQPDPGAAGQHGHVDAGGGGRQRCEPHAAFMIVSSIVRHFETVMSRGLTFKVAPLLECARKIK